jgi:hypothetical protein
MHHLWVPLIGYSHIMNLTTKGWLGFVFDTAKDVKKILLLEWWLDTSILTLKIWKPLFNPSMEIFDFNPIWVKLPKLPLEWWLKYCLKALGNRLGGFITTMEETNTSTKRFVPNILIKLRTQVGLYSTIDLLCGNKSHSYVLDYLNFPFHYAHYHRVGYLFEHCE